MTPAARAMRIAEYRAVRNDPLEWRGTLERYVREVIIVSSLPYSFAYGRLSMIFVLTYVTSSSPFLVKYVQSYFHSICDLICLSTLPATD